MEQREARGYDDAEGSICRDCVEEPYLAKWIDENATEAMSLSRTGRPSWTRRSSGRGWLRKPWP